MQTRTEQLNRLSETAVNGHIVHKLDLIGIVRICGVHYFNVYRRYNNVYEIVVEDSNGDFYLQRDNLLRRSIGKVLCLSEEQMNSMYTTDVYSFRHGGTPPTSSPAPENMGWSEIHREWCAIEVNLRGIYEEYHAFMNQFYASHDPSSDSDMDRSDEETSDEEEKDEDENKDEKSDNEEESEEDGLEEDEYADMPELVSDSDSDEPETPPRNTVIQPPEAPVRTPIEVHVYHSTPICCRNLAEEMFRAYKGKRTFEQCSESDQDSSEDVSVKEESEESEDEEVSQRGSGPDDYIILRNGTKYRKIN